jgi:hypothetical protein
MAIAGRILLMPKGAYNRNETYEMLDMVDYADVTWIAKKTSVGITPSESNSEYWFPMAGVSTEKFEAFKRDILESVSVYHTKELPTGQSINLTPNALFDAKVIIDIEPNSSVSIIKNESNLAFSYNTYLGHSTETVTITESTTIECEQGACTVMYYAKKITAGTEDLVAGISELPSGSIYIVYE